MREVSAIYQEMRETFARKAGFEPNDGCDAAVRLYALAAEVQSLEIQAEWVLRQSFPQTAEGEYLDRFAEMRAISRHGAECARGTLRFSCGGTAVNDLTIPLGTVCMTAEGVAFVTEEEGVLTAGTPYVDVPARAQVSGAGGNVIAGAVTQMAPCPLGITTCGNPAAFSGGCDAEDDASLRARVLASYRRLPNGANAAFYEQEALAVEGVAAAKAISRAHGIGTVDVCIASNAGTPDNVLRAAVLAKLNEKREIAVDLQVIAPTTQTINVTAEITAAAGYDTETVTDAVRAAVNAYFNGSLLGKSVRTAELTAMIFAVEGVENCHLLAPTADSTAGDTKLPVLGTLTVTEMS